MLIATTGGVGHAPAAPGTVASVVTVAGIWLAAPSPAALGVLVVAVTVMGVWAAQRAAPLLGGDDPGAIVVDEVAGMALAALAVPPTAGALAAALVLFRVFDIAKPWPAGAAERLPGGLGIVADDLVAGLYALVILLAARAGLGWP